MNNIAFAQQHKIFKRLESVTNYANLDTAQRLAYDEDLKIYRDFQNCMDFKMEEGFKKGREEGREEEQGNVIRKLLKNGMTAESISQLLELPLNLVNKIACNK